MKRLIGLLLCCLPVLSWAAEPEVRVQNRLVPAGSAVVGGTLTLEVDLLVDTWFTAAPILPKLDLPGAVVSTPSGEAQHLNEKLDGKTFFGLRFSYQITPQAAQHFAIPALEFQVQPGQASGPVKVRSEPIGFVAKALAGGGAEDEHHLVARKVTLSQDIQRSHDPLRVGDSITRHLTIEAEGAQAMLIPPPQFAEVEGLKRYAQTPKVKALDDGRGGTTGGVREDSANYVVTEAGHYSLPAIELQWWDATTGEAQTVSVPAVELKAEEGGYQGPFSVSEDLRALGQKARLHISGHWLLFAGLLVLGSALAYAARPWGKAAMAAWQHRRAAHRLAWLGSADYAWQLANRQLAEQPTQLGGLYLWVRRSSGSQTLTGFSRPVPDSVRNSLLAFLKSRYGQGEGGCMPDDLARTLPAARGALRESDDNPRARHGLKALNP